MIFYRYSILYFRNLVQIRHVSVGQTAYPQQNFKQNIHLKNQVDLMGKCNFGNLSVEA